MKINNYLHEFFMMPKRFVVVLGVVLSGFSSSLALTNGPVTPEYTDFESVDVTDMVNLHTGEFSYVLPVMTVPGPGLGFPIALSYHSNVKAKQEATWIGLGWNLQAGAITRQVNNIPDDFNKTTIGEYIKTKKMHGWTADIGYNGATIGVSWDSENGYGGMVGYSFSMGPVRLGYSLGANGVYEGVGITLGVGVSGSNGLMGGSAGLSVGWHSKRGYSAGLSVGVSMAVPAGANGQSMAASLGSMGASMTSKGGSSGGFSGPVSVNNSSTVKGNQFSNSEGISIPIPTPIGYFSLGYSKWESWIEGYLNDIYFGYLYSDITNMECETEEELLDCSKSRVSSPSAKKQRFKMEISQFERELFGQSGVKLAKSSQDAYIVSTQGMSGSFKPHKKEDGDYYSFRELFSENYEASCRGVWGTFADCDRKFSFDHMKYLEEISSDETVANRNFFLKTMSDTDEDKSKNNIYWRMDGDQAGSEYGNPDLRDEIAEFSHQSKKIKAYYDDAGQINAFTIVKPDGVKYIYSYPLWVKNEVIQSISDNSPDTKTEKNTPPYVSSWLLTAILSPDYVDVGSTSCESFGKQKICLPEHGDIGGWVRFYYGTDDENYTDKATREWRSPYVNPDLMNDANVAYSFTGYGSKQRTFGWAEMAYLTKVETPSHYALFDLGTREDGRVHGDRSFVVPFYNWDVISNTDDPTGHETCIYDEHGSVPRHFDVEEITLMNLNSWEGEELDFTFTGIQRNWGATSLGFCGDDYEQTRTQTCGVEITENMVNAYVGLSGRDIGMGSLLKFADSDNQCVKGLFSHETILNREESLHGEKFKLEITPNIKTRMKKLKGIELFNKMNDKDISNDIKINEVSFVHSYELAQNTPNSNESGRLTLKSVKIDNMPRYEFSYENNADFQNKEFDFELGKWDKWGYFCSNCSNGNNQNYSGDTEWNINEINHEPDGNANQWNLSNILLPSGGEIEIVYEPKTYTNDASYHVAKQQGNIEDQFLNKEVVNLTKAYENNNDLPCVSYPEKPKLIASTAWKYQDGLGNTQSVYEADHPNPFVCEDAFDLPVGYEGKIPDLYKYVFTYPINDKEKEYKSLPLMLYKDFEFIITRKVWHGDDKFYEWDYYGATDKVVYFNVKDLPVFTQERGKETGHEAMMLEYDGRSATNNRSEHDAPQSIFNRDDENCTIHTNYYKCTIITDTPYKYAYISRQASPEALKLYVINHLQVFGIYEEPIVKLGGGSRVKEVSMKDALGKDNVVSYQYGEGAVPVIPNSFAQVNQSLITTGQGVEAFIGGSSVGYGKVGVTFKDDEKSYTTIHRFITPNDLPIKFNTIFLTNDRTQEIANHRVEIEDFSSMWGQLYKKIDYNKEINFDEKTDESTGIVREVENKWISAIVNSKSEFFKDEVFSKNNVRLPIINVPDKMIPNNDLSANKFGLQQSLYSHIYYVNICSDESREAYTQCMLGPDLNRSGIQSTQVVHKKYLPQLREKSLEQDGLINTESFGGFDYQTGKSLRSMKINSDNSIIINEELPAYVLYNQMLDSNMLTQSFGSVAYHYKKGLDYKGDDAPSIDGVLNVKDVISVGITEWRATQNSYTGPRLNERGSYPIDNYVWRQFSELKWNDKGEPYSFKPFSFDLHNSISLIDAGNNTWNTNGFNTRYDDFGHVVEFQNNDGTYVSQIYGYGHTLATAFVKNSARHETFYESFELEQDILDDSRFHPFVSGYQSELSTTNYKSGQSSLKIPRSTNERFSISNSVMYPSQMPYKLTDGRKYVLSLWYFDDIADTDSDIYITNEDPADVDKSGSECAKVEFKGTGSQKWKRAELIFEAKDMLSEDDKTKNICSTRYLQINIENERNMSLYVDEFRLRPIDAIMTTYTYDAKGKLTSFVDERELVTYFEYDNNGNLIAQKNDDGVLISEKSKRFGRTN